MPRRMKAHDDATHGPLRQLPPAFAGGVDAGRPTTPLGVCTSFHTAAILDGSRWPSPAQRALSVAVNVGGVANLVHAAREAGALRLVHTREAPRA